MGKGVHQPSDRPQTQKKLELLAAVFDVWLTVWLAQRTSSSVPLVVLDLFAGTGESYGAGGKLIDGSTPVLLNAVARHATKISEQGRTVILRCVEAKTENCEALQAKVDYLLGSDAALAAVVDARVVNESANAWVDSHRDHLPTVGSAPAFVLLDPDGLQIDKATVEALMALPWRTDFFLNYMVEGVARVAGAAASDCASASGNRVKMVKFLGAGAKDAAYFGAQLYADNVFTPGGYYSVPYPIKHPQKAMTQYVMIYASKNEKVVKKVMSGVLANAAKETYGQPSIFDVATLQAVTPTMGPEGSTS